MEGGYGANEEEARIERAASLGYCLALKLLRVLRGKGQQDAYET